MVVVNFPPGIVSPPHRHPCQTFGYLLEGNGGPVRAARSFDEHAGHLANAIAGRAGSEDRLRSFVERFVRPYGTREAAASRLVDAIESLIAGARV